MNSIYPILAMTTAGIVLLAEVDMVVKNIAADKRKSNPHFSHLLIIANSPQVFQNELVTYAVELIAILVNRLGREIVTKRRNHPILLSMRRS